MSDVDKEMEQLFISDTAEAIGNLEEKLLQLEQGIDPEIVNELFRATHSIKGGAGLLEFNCIAKLAHAMENLLSCVREGTVDVQKGHIDALLEGTDLIKQHLDCPREDFDVSNLLIRLQPEKNSESNDSYQDDLAQLLALSGASIEPVEKIIKEELPPEIEEAPKASHIEKKSSHVAVSKNNETLRVYVSKLNKLVTLAGELVLARNRLIQISDQSMNNNPALKNVLQNVDLVTTEMQTEIMGMRMQPISLVFSKFPRTIRDIAQKLNKKIEVEIQGETVELDKTIIEGISDPLTHLVRNSADHGIETFEERCKTGKPSQAKIILRAYHMGGMVYIEVSDDGRGIDADRIAQKAVEKGIVTMEQMGKMKVEDKVKLIFAPGFSTAEKVSDLSGRGVGMDVVRNNIERIGGSVEVETVLGQGTTVKIVLPLTLAIISSLIVEVGGMKFAIPQVSFEELLKLTPEDFSKYIATIEDGQVLRLRGELLPLMHLSDCISLPRKFRDPESGELLPERRKFYSQVSIRSDGTEISDQPDYSQLRRDKQSLKMLIVSTGTNRFALVVDKIIGFEEIIVKSLPSHLRQISSYAGVTILGDGRVALIIDVIGIASKNKLVFEKTKNIQRKVARTVSQQAEVINMLLFDNGTVDRFAVPVAHIRRVDKVHSSQVQEIGGKFCLNYMNETTRILCLDDYVSTSKKVPLKERGEFYILIPKNLKVPLALAVGNHVETKEILLQLEENTLKDKFLIGSSIVENQITLVLDLHGVCEFAEPRCFRQKDEMKIQVKQRVLLAEDTPLYQKIAKGYLAGEGYDVVLAEDGNKAWEILQKDNDICALVTDIEMPIMNGYELAQMVRGDQRFRSLPIVAVTSLNNKSAIERGTKCGIDRWLIKIDKMALLNTLEELLRKQNAN